MTGCFIIGGSERTARAPAPAERAGVQPGEKRPMISKQPGMGVLPWDMKKRRCNYQGRNAALDALCAQNPLPSEIHQSNSRRQYGGLIGGRQPIELANAAAN